MEGSWVGASLICRGQNESKSDLRAFFGPISVAMTLD
jgi:hypothetical protein